MTEPLLHLDGVVKRFGATVAADRLSLTITRGEFFTLLGPSGSGKSTILRIIAGLDRPDEGRVLLEGRDLAGVPPWRRNMGMVFQSYAVFPHMTVAQNVGYGLKVRRVPAARIRQRVGELLDLVGLAPLADKNAALLSGGEQQRVALARALAVEPAVLLLDEPLSALDEKIRREMQTELKEIQRKTGTTFIYVTHDQEEALTMSDRIAVIHSGRCVQCGAPEALFRRPRTRFVAEFFRGCNVLEADLERADPDQLVLRLGSSVLSVPAQSWAERGPVRHRVSLAVRAEDVRLGEAARQCPVQAAGTLVTVIYRGTNIDHVVVLADGQRVVATSTRREVDTAARPVVVGFDPATLVVLAD